jgi:hypothetical protein
MLNPAKKESVSGISSGRCLQLSLCSLKLPFCLKLLFCLLLLLLLPSLLLLSFLLQHPAYFFISGLIRPHFEGLRVPDAPDDNISCRAGILQCTVSLFADLNVVLKQLFGEVLQAPSAAQSLVRREENGDGLSSKYLRIHDLEVVEPQDLEIVVESVTDQHGI